MGIEHHVTRKLHRSTTELHDQYKITIKNLMSY